MDAPNPVPNLWWKSPAAICLGALVLVCSVGVMLEDKLVPKPKDDGPKVVLPGGGSFCDPLPVQPGGPSHNIPALKEH
jgi:hypothetical protein